MKTAGATLLAVIAFVALFAPWLSPNAPDRRFTDLLYAPPTTVSMLDDGVRAPFIRPWRLVDRLRREFTPDPPVTLRWFADGHVVTAKPDAGAPLLLLGADAYGRDVYSRLLHGGRTTLALAAVATLGATLLGLLIGGVSGASRGWVDTVLSRLTEFVLVIPAIYAALAIRAVLPLVLPASTVFALLTAIFAILGAPIVARGVRAIVLTEREQDYVVAARSAGAGTVRLLLRHLLPAARGHAAVQATLLFPAFVVAEATLSYVGLGFPVTTPTWGTMLRDAANISLLADMPWLLAPAAVIFCAVLGANLVVQGGGRPPVQLERPVRAPRKMGSGVIFTDHPGK
jgi:peptide/nickel transport system permease protein